jgi:2-polyprenyl-3-methyl-5-hydroxy-6-metoxy-1,4-benzoquinol methylase
MGARVGLARRRPAMTEKTRERFDEVMAPFGAHPAIALGPWTSANLVRDPKHLCFVLSRYKFCAKMLHGKKDVMEIGIGDGFGLPLVAQAVGHIYAVDWDPRLLEDTANRLGHLQNVSYVHLNVNEGAPTQKVDAIYMVDVIEHMEPAKERTFFEHAIGCLPSHGVMLVGTPNIAAAQYASSASDALHINLKSMDTLRALMALYFSNVFMFGMNDEVVHTGFGGMCHYIWALAVGPRR